MNNPAGSPTQTRRRYIFQLHGVSQCNHRTLLPSNRPPTATSTPGVITQAELQQLYDYRRRRSAIRELTSSIVERLTAGAIVEEGKLTAEVKDVEMRVFSQEKVAELVGEAKAAELKAQLPVTTQSRLMIDETGIAADYQQPPRRRPSRVDPIIDMPG